MIGLDTNVIARHLLGDDPAQCTAVAALLRSAAAKGLPVVIAQSVLLELEWVLRSSANCSKPNVIGVFKQLLESTDLEIERESIVEGALYLYESSAADFAECLFSAQYTAMGAVHMASFDRQAQRLPGVRPVGPIAAVH